MSVQRNYSYQERVDFSKNNGGKVLFDDYISNDGELVNGVVIVYPLNKDLFEYLYFLNKKLIKSYNIDKKTVNDMIRNRLKEIEEKIEEIRDS